jgi:5-hydroxyisourate hydrolase-like protein (transthyretin family)
MRLRTAVIVSACVITVGGLGITVASGATPIFDSDEPPAPDLALDCPPTLELGDTGSLKGTLLDETGKPIGRQEVTVTRDDEFGGPTPVGTVTTTANDGTFADLSDLPVNRGNQDYVVTFAGDTHHAAASAECTTDVHGTNSTLDAVEPTSVAVGDDVQVTGTLETASGEPVAGATITATDTVEGTDMELEEATTDADGAYTVAVPSIALGSHTIDFSYLGDEVIEPSDDNVTITLADDTTITTEPVGRMDAGKDIKVVGHLESAKGEPLADATITATDTVDGTTTDLAETTTDSEGDFTVTAPTAAAGEHQIAISYAGQGPNKPVTHQVDVTVKHETKLALDGPESLPAEPGPMTFKVTLTDGDNAAVADAEVRFNDGGAGQRVKNTDANGKVQFTRFKVSDNAPLRIEVTYAGDSTHWESSKARTWRAMPEYAFESDQARYVAGDEGAFTVTTPDQTVPTTIKLKPHGRPAITITPASDSNQTAFTRTMLRNSTLTVSTESTDLYQAGSADYAVRVAPRIDQELLGSYDQSGDTYLVHANRDPRLRATVTPSRPGRCLTAYVQKFTGGRYQAVQTSACRRLSVDSQASYTLTGNPSPGARFRIRFGSPADDMNIAGNGTWTNLRFTS